MARSWVFGFHDAGKELLIHSSTVLSGIFQWATTADFVQIELWTAL